MATWNDPKTWVASAKLAAAQLNTYVSELLRWLYAPPGAGVYRSALQTLTDATWTAITWQSSDWVSSGWWSAGVNPTRITVDRASRYRIGVAVTFDANSTGLRGLRIKVNGSTVYGLEIRDATTGVDDRLEASRTLLLAVGDYIEIEAYQSSGGNLDLKAADSNPRCTLDWAGSAPS